MNRQVNCRMKTETSTLRQLIDFQPQTNREKEMFNISRNILEIMNVELKQGVYYLGGQIKMSYDDEINVGIFETVRAINKRRDDDYGEPCNSWESMSVCNHKHLLNETEKLVKTYFEIMNSREK